MLRENKIKKLQEIVHAHKELKIFMEIQNTQACVHVHTHTHTRTYTRICEKKNLQINTKFFGTEDTVQRIGERKEISVG